MTIESLRKENEQLKRDLDQALIALGKITLGDPEALKIAAEMRKATRGTIFDRLSYDHKD